MNKAAALRAKEKVLEAKKESFRKGLPHLFSKYYAWQRAFFEALIRMCFMTAANQIGKSNIQIRKCIHWATCKKLWPKLWPQYTQGPNLFWYMYPDKRLAHTEFELKWRGLLPQGEMKDHPVYGWHHTLDDNGYIDIIFFNSGVQVHFKTYSQRVTSMQAATVFAIFFDEELPEAYYSELQVRLRATKGYLSGVFTATLGQAFWERVMEGTGESELLPDAWKKQVSMDECIVFDDGSPGLFTEEDVAQARRDCKSKDEERRRVDGRFVKSSENMIYPKFDPTRHYIKPRKIPDDWHKYVAVDIGTGGKHGHSPAMAFLAVRPDFRLGWLYKGWKGDDGPDYTAGDVLSIFRKIRGDDILVSQHFDQQAKDFGTIATRQGEPFLPSVKDHETGEGLVNDLFENDMLFIFDDQDGAEPQMHKLGTELRLLKKDTPKNKRKDDFSDAGRYVVNAVPWDWDALKGGRKEASLELPPPVTFKALTDAEKEAESIRRRRGEHTKKVDDLAEFRSEIDFWNDQYGT